MEQKLRQSVCVCVYFRGSGCAFLMNSALCPVQAPHSTAWSGRERGRQTLDQCIETAENGHSQTHIL